MSSKNSLPCKWIHFECFPDFERGGRLIPIEGGQNIPFQIMRLWDIHNMPKDGIRGGHAHKKAQQVIRALAGSFWVVASADKNSPDMYIFALNTPDIGLYVPPGVWIDVKNFSEDAICQVYSDRLYEEEDYIKD